MKKLKINNNLIEMIKRHEGFSYKPYRCSAGKLTCGWGHNLEAHDISKQVAEQMLKEDIERAFNDILYIFPNFYQYSQNRQNALIDMIFNLGKSRFCLFKKMISAINKEDWEEATRQAKDSLWHIQVGVRAIKIENLLMNG